MGCSFCELLDEVLVPWLEDQPLTWWKNLIFQQDNAPAHKAKYTSSWLKDSSFKEENIIVWPANILYLNPIENLCIWAIIKRRVQHNEWQFSSLADLWKAIKDAAASGTPAEILKLMSFVDSRIVKIIKNGGGHFFLHKCL